MLGQIAWFALGAVLLMLGADSLVKGAAGLALSWRVKPFLVGLVVLGLGTAVPELAVSLEAMRTGHAGIALGNVVGSSIANFGLVLGAAALAAPFATGLRLSAVLLPLLIAGTALAGALGYDLALARLDGALLLALFCAMLALLLVRAPREAEAVQRTFAEAAAVTQPGVGRMLLRIALGAAVMLYGTWHLIRAASTLAQWWGWSDLRIGLTVVAIGTLLPELATAVLAARRGHGDLAIGNAIGGSLVNLTLVLGACALWKTIPVPQQLIRVELPALALFALALYPMIRGDAHLSRREGAVLLGAYLAFLAWQGFLATA
jgi:cation:H+ antiporter